MFKKLFLLLAVFALASMACGFQIKLPPQKTPGPDVTDKVEIAYPNGDAHLIISFGAGELTLKPGAETALVSGTATYNIADFKPEIKTDGANVTLQQGNYQVDGLPSFSSIKNKWDLKLGSKPFDLKVEAGAYKGDFDFGGLSLTGLTIQDGAAEADVTFSSPNKVEMTIFRYETGASNVNLYQLANANANTFILKSGAGNYKFDFRGELKRDATITLESGVSNVVLVIPKNVHAVLQIESGLSNIDTPPGWSKSGNTYTQEGTGPTLTFLIKMGAGNLSISQ